MKMKRIWILTFAVSAFFYNSCSENKTAQKDNTDISAHSEPINNAHLSYQKTDIVPNDEVCMVNDAYMGRKQIEVIHEGKKYYGCCAMCEARIPKEKEVRVAIDPISKKQVDKADAIIAISGDNGEVSYFENKETYNAFFQK